MYWVIGGVALAVLGFAVARWRPTPKRGSAIGALAALGLEKDGDAWRSADGVTVTYAASSDGAIVVTCRRREAPIRLSLGPNGRLKRLLVGRDIVTGDRAFDDAVRVAGDVVQGLAFLDAAARRRVADAVAGGWTADEGAWSRTLTADLALNTRDAAAAVGPGLALARDATVATDAVERLAERARADDAPGVRRRALEVLADAAPDAPVTASALAAAARDREDEVALAAVARMPTAALLGKVVVGSARPSVRAAALDRLAATHPDHGETIAGVALLASAIARLHPALGVALAGALGRVRHADPEGALLALLAHADGDMQAAAATTLGRVGTIARAVPALGPLRDRVLGGDAKRAAREAIAAIQARAGDVAAGRLSVAEPRPDGGLAVVDDAAAAPRTSPHSGVRQVDPVTK